jgi:hypothetical protein
MLIIRENQRKKLKNKGVLVQPGLGQSELIPGTSGGMMKSASSRDLASRTMTSGTAAHTLGLQAAGRSRDKTPTRMNESYHAGAGNFDPLIDPRDPFFNHRGTVAA